MFSGNNVYIPSYAIMGLNEFPGLWMNVFVQITIPYSGKVQLWTYEAAYRGVFYATVWRVSDDEITLLGKNRIEAIQIGAGVSQENADRKIRKGSIRIGAWASQEDELGEMCKLLLTMADI